MRAIEIRVRAERRCGELLAEMEKAKGAPGPGRGKAGSTVRPPFTDAPTLADLGISKTQSSRWQQLAEVPEEEFEAAFVRPETVSKLGVLPNVGNECGPADEPAASDGEAIQW